MPTVGLDPFQGNIIGIIQARMGSTRLPGKVMMDLAGAPMLARVVARSRRARALNEIVVATTTSPRDDVVAEWCQRQHCACFRGAEEDVLDRYYQAADQWQADVVVRIAADRPLIEPELIDLVVEAFLESPALDYASNVSESSRTYPWGLDVEVMSFSALKRVWREDSNPAWREHVTPYIYRNPDKFQIRIINNDVDLSFLRWTVDTADDMELVRTIYSYFDDDSFSWRQILPLIEEHPELLEINRNLTGVKKTGGEF